MFLKQSHVTKAPEYPAKTTRKHDSLKVHHKIAIIGLSGVFPGATTPEQLWENLKNGVESITYFSDEALKQAGWEPAVYENPNYVKSKGMLTEVEYFDAAFFGYSPQEAKIIDPQQKIFLECAWNALENAGYSGDRYSGKIGVYGGVGNNHYYTKHLLAHPDLLENTDESAIMLGNDKDFLATRTAYKLNLKGPAVTVQTACSSSLVSVHMACQALLNNECSMALAGGVSLGTLNTPGYLYKEGMILSPDGHCKAFDSEAQGTVPGQGAGVVLLKNLEMAIDEGDTIHAVILSTAINNDGTTKVGFHAPSVEGQKKVILEAFQAAGVAAESIGYVEAHATGTKIGDPIEFAALTQAYEQLTDKKNFCTLGAVKNNLGHLDAAAGITGMIKVVMALKHQQKPPLLHFSKPNPQIDLENSPFVVNLERLPWEQEKTPRRAAVSSFGIGGTNAHSILEEAPIPELIKESPSPQLLLLSAKTESALEMMADCLAKHLKQFPEISLADVAYTLQTGRGEWRYRQILVCQDVQETILALEQKNVGRLPTSNTNLKEKAVVFIFPETFQFSSKILKELYDSHSIFREEVDQISMILKETLDLDLQTFLFNETVWQTKYSPKETSIFFQLAIFTVEYALAQLWKAWGILPHALFGKGMGVMASACVAGMFSLKETLQFLVHWGQCIPFFQVRKCSKCDASPSLLPFPQEAIDWFCKMEKNAPTIPWFWKGKQVHAEDVKNTHFWMPLFQENTLLEETTKSVEMDHSVELEMTPCPMAALPKATFANVGKEDPSSLIRLLTALGELWLSGMSIDWSKFYGKAKRRRLSLPTYPFERKRHWVDSQSNKHPLFQPKKPDPIPPPSEMEIDLEIQTQVLECWQQCLGIGKIRSDDDFFEIGGDSFLAIEMFERLNRTFQTDLRPDLILENPTVNELVHAIEGHISANRFGTSKLPQLPSMVRIQAGTLRYPLFLPHTGGGHVYFYRDLALHLGKDQSVYGIKSRGLLSEEVPMKDIETMASNYLPELLTLQPKGPYMLGGASFGGMVAFEMAQQLKQQGKQVELLFLIDTPGPGQMPSKHKDVTALLMHLFGKKLSLNLELLKNAPPEEQVAILVEQTNTMNCTDLLPPEFGIPFLEVLAANQTAMFQYQPQPYEGKIIYFRHQESHPDYPRHPELPWIDCAKAGIEIHTIPGDHYTMNASPNVQSIAARLKPQICRIQNLE